MYLKIIDISSNKYPQGNTLSNFTPYAFKFRNVECKSMEGLIQALKFKNHEKQKETCLMNGYQAKKAGKDSDWKTDLCLYWQDEKYLRYSRKYQQLLDEAFNSLASNEIFTDNLIQTTGYELTHSMGKRNIWSTALTEFEFCSRLMNIRDEKQNIRITLSDKLNELIAINKLQEEGNLIEYDHQFKEAQKSLARVITQEIIKVGSFHGAVDPFLWMVIHEPTYKDHICPWQITYFDKDIPHRHNKFTSLEEAVKIFIYNLHPEYNNLFHQYF